MVLVERKCFSAWWWNSKNQLRLVYICILKTSLKMLIIFHSINIFEIRKGWVWKNRNNPLFPLCSEKSKLILDKNINILIWCCRIRMSQREGSWKLHFWINANISLTWKALRSLLSVLCDNSSKEILLLFGSEKNWQNND